MSDFEPQMVQHDSHCEPQEPPPGTDDVCEGTITGTVRLECCCPRLYSRTLQANIGPQAEADMANFIVATANSYEANGYVVLGHSLTDTGAGWRLFLTVGWYA